MNRVGHAFIKKRMRDENARLRRRGLRPLLLPRQLVRRQRHDPGPADARAPGPRGRASSASSWLPCASATTSPGEINSGSTTCAARPRAASRSATPTRASRAGRHLGRLRRLALQRAAVQHRAAAAPEPRGGVGRGDGGAPRRGPRRSSGRRLTALTRAEVGRYHRCRDRDSGGRSSVGRVRASQARCRGFEPRRPLHHPLAAPCAAASGTFRRRSAWESSASPREQARRNRRPRAGSPRRGRPAPAAPAPAPRSARRACVIGAKTTIKGEITRRRGRPRRGDRRGPDPHHPRPAGRPRRRRQGHRRGAVGRGERRGDRRLPAPRIAWRSRPRAGSTGNIRAPRVVIAEGAIFKGNSDMSGRRDERRTRPPPPDPASRNRRPWRELRELHRAARGCPPPPGRPSRIGTPPTRASSSAPSPTPGRRTWSARSAPPARPSRAGRPCPPPSAGEILYRAAEILVRRKEEFSRDMTREMGKVLDETRGDVQEAIDMTYYMAGEGRRQFGQTTPSELPNKFQMSVRMPVGIAGLITPWNFPMAIPSWKMMPALVLGNTVVIKPATDTPLSVVNLVKVLEEAGLPKGVVNMVTGGGARVGTPLMSHQDVGHRLVHRLDRRRPQGLRGLRARLQALPPRDGRQERHHGDGRRAPRPRGRGRALGRLRHHRPALHRGQPRGRPQEGLRRVRRAVRGAGEGASRSATGSTPRSRWGRASTRASSQTVEKLRGDRQGRGGEAPGRRQPPRPGRARQGLLPRADDLRRLLAPRCASPARRSSAPWSP